jgi:hypothetical protein
MATAHTTVLAGQLRAVDRSTITITRGSKVATVPFRRLAQLHHAAAGDSISVRVRRTRNRWTIVRLRITRRAAQPTVAISGGPSGTVHTGDASFAYTYTGPVIWLACSLDGSDWFGCDDPATLPTLGPGSHRFSVLVMNGRHSAIATRDWTVAADVPPVAALTVPVNTAVPVISGTARSKQTVSASTGTWSGSVTGFSYQWERCTSTSASSCSPIGGATGSSYTCQTADIDLYLRVEVTATNPAGQATAVSAATAKTLPS